MANKRDLKKYIRTVCGDLAAEIITAYHSFEGVDSKTVGTIVGKIAELQCGTLAKASVSVDKSKKSARAAYQTLTKEFNEAVCGIVAEMNAAMPAEARKEMKEEAAK